MRTSNRVQFIEMIKDYNKDKWFYERNNRIKQIYLDNPEKYGNENLMENWETLGQKILDEEVCGSDWIKQIHNRIGYISHIVNQNGDKWFNKIIGKWDKEECDGKKEMMNYLKYKESKGLVYDFSKKDWTKKENLDKDLIPDFSLLDETEMYGYDWTDYMKKNDELNEKVEKSTIHIN
jgi:hypothetical protein|tara:strand:+ start:132 stop:665 length:534 start_codon:yes stop_codon:yes gene_type:complete